MDSRLANEHMEVVQRALKLMKPRRARRKRAKAPRFKDGKAGDRQIIPTIGKTWATVCRRPDCRRRFACAYGMRRGESLDGSEPAPCWAAMPKAVTFALPFALMRKFEPQNFVEEPGLERREAECMRLARADLGRMEDEARAARPSQNTGELSIA